LLPSKDACSDAAFQALMRKRDPLALGLPNKWAVKLVRRLLVWDAHSRITAERALEHAYFRRDGRGFACEDLSVGHAGAGGAAGAGANEYEFEDEALAHCPRSSV